MTDVSEKAPLTEPPDEVTSDVEPGDARDNPFFVWQGHRAECVTPPGDFAMTSSDLALFNPNLYLQQWAALPDPERAHGQPAATRQRAPTNGTTFMEPSVEALRRVLLLAVLLTAGSWVALSPQAGACSCVAITDSEAFDRAEAVFLGEHAGIAFAEDTSVLGAYEAEVVFKVDRVYKGDVAARQSILTSASESSCGIALSGRGPVLVFASLGAPGTNGEGKLTANLCAGTRFMRGLAVPESFGPGEPFEDPQQPADTTVVTQAPPPTRVHTTSPAAATGAPAAPDGPSKTVIVTLAAGLVGLFAAAGALWLRRSRRTAGKHP